MAGSFSANDCIKERRRTNTKGTMMPFGTVEARRN